MSGELKTVMEFCLRHAEQCPVKERVSLYLGLAELCGEPKRAAHFRSLAVGLEQADKRCKEFSFEYLNGGAA